MGGERFCVLSKNTWKCEAEPNTEEIMKRIVLLAIVALTVLVSLGGCHPGWWGPHDGGRHRDGGRDRGGDYHRDGGHDGDGHGQRR